MNDKKRKTRLKGTEAKKPCFDCGKIKDRFKDFKPRWAGCITHRTERGRRFYKAGCAECEKIVNGNIRQPRCIECDKVRPKKQTEPTPTTPTTPTIETLAAVATEEPSAPPLDLPEAVTVGKTEAAREVAEAAGVAVVDAPVVEVKPEDVLGLPERVLDEVNVEDVVASPEVQDATKAILLPEPKVEAPVVVVATPEVEVKPAPEAAVVSVPPPAPVAPAVPTPRKKVQTKADLFALFSGDDEAETKAPF